MTHTSDFHITYSHNTVFCVVGGTAGIGEVLLKKLSKTSASVCFTYHHNKEKAHSLAHLYPTDRIAWFQMDLTSPEAVQQTFQNIAHHYPRLDHLIILSSYADPQAWNKPFEELSYTSFELTFKIDVQGAFLCIQNAIPLLRKSEHASILLFSSSSSIRGDAEMLLYGPAKMALIGLTRAAARALAPRIRVNALAPGSVETKWLKTWSLSPSDIQELKNETLLKRMSSPEEIADVILFLCSSSARGITGQTILVDNGLWFV